LIESPIEPTAAVAAAAALDSGRRIAGLKRENAQLKREKGELSQ